MCKHETESSAVCGMLTASAQWQAHRPQPRSDAPPNQPQPGGGSGRRCLSSGGGCAFHSTGHGHESRGHDCQPTGMWGQAQCEVRRRVCVEVDKDGYDLQGYQNKRCAGYRLTFDNNGEPFRWISNYQVWRCAATHQSIAKPSHLCLLISSWSRPSSPSSPKAATTHARQVEGEEDEGRGGSLQPQMLRQPRGGCTQAAADSSCFCCSW